MVIMSAPKAAICFALSRKYSSVNTGFGTFLPISFWKNEGWGYLGSTV